jgi:1A family penicillin-binding protein
MAERFRGWKGSHKASPQFKNHSVGKPNYLKGEKPLRRFLGAFFALVMNGLIRLTRWFFRQKGFWRKFVYLGLAAGLMMFIFVGILFVWYSFQVPDPNRLVNRVVPESTKIYDRNGELLYEVFGEAKRTLISLDEIPETARQATIAVEDQNFYEHGGIDVKGIARASFRFVINFGPSGGGGSTLTQQFVKNAILTREKTFARKIKEAILAIQIEKQLEKNEILQLYFNEIPYGSNAYGIAAASRVFFGKSPGELELVEVAYLTALPQAPTFYSPYGPNRDRLDARADTVLQLMYEEGYISESQRNQAQNEVVEFRDFGTGILAPHFVLYVQDLMAQKFGELGLQEGGFQVTTTLDLKLQEAAEEAVARYAERNQDSYNASNASLVAIDPRNGHILAMVGSRDFFNEEIDGAVNVALRPRQPGSSFKPYIYATAFKQGMSPATMLVDVVTNFGEFGGSAYIPKNYDNAERGPVSVRTALQGSLNIPAVKTTLLVGVGNAIDTAESMGISSLKDRSRFGPSIVLGGAEVTLLEHTSAYGVFATGGIRHEPAAIIKIEDHRGEVLEEFEESRGKETLDPQVAYLINNVLSDNDARAFAFGASNFLTLGGRPVAAKTGTTQEFKDAWTVGYTPQLAAGVWVGNNQNQEMRAGGSTLAAPIWNDFMRRALADQPALGFARPDGISEQAVDSLSGKIPTAYTPSTKTEVFASFNLPKENDDVHVPVIDGGQTKVYTVLHSEMPENSLWEEPVRRWAEANGYAYPPSDSFVPPDLDQSISVKINAPGEVKELPWSFSVETSSAESIRSAEVFLDNSLLFTGTSGDFELVDATPHVNGKHKLMVRITSGSGRKNETDTDVRFNLGQDNIIIIPKNSQSISLPTNLVLESNRETDPNNVKFFIRSAQGATTQLAGTVSRQRVSSDVFYYALGWRAETNPGPGSYELFAEVDGRSSDTISIQLP